MYADAPSMDPHAPNPAADPLHDPHAAEWERTYSMFTHLSLLAVHIFVPVVAALVMWLIKREQSPFVDDHGKEAINFQISLVIYFVASLCLSFCGVGVVLAIAVYALGLIGMVMGAMAAYKGRYFRYPMTMRLVK
ncbi:MAG: orotate phosphoribosyltransferase [Phycisphaerae bacterium]|nr:MAG: orotate phosphoribosyltransferase [Phycisphaerae bacterium]